MAIKKSQMHLQHPPHKAEREPSITYLLPIYRYAWVHAFLTSTDSWRQLHTDTDTETDTIQSYGYRYPIRDMLPIEY